MSILMGVAQMNLGIVLSYFDARFHGNALDIRYCIFCWDVTEFEGNLQYF